MNVNANRRRIRCRSDFWSPRIAWMKSNHTELRLYGNRDLWVELASPKLTSCFITALHFHRINVESYANCSRYDTSRTTFLDEGNLWIKKFLEKRKIVRARYRIGNVWFTLDVKIERFEKRLAKSFFLNFCRGCRETNTNFSVDHKRRYFSWSFQPVLWLN